MFSFAKCTTVSALMTVATIAADGGANARLRGPQFSVGTGDYSGSSGCTYDDPSFDNFLLVEQWPGTIGVNAPGFTLHGLWPSRTGANVANYPCQCTNQTFDMGAVQSIMDELNEFWPSENGDNQEFWTHEFTKHGTCAEAIPALNTELKFMSGALQLRQQQDTLGVLKKADITPSSTQTYSLSALGSAIGSGAVFKCNNNHQLLEVATCYSKSLTQSQCDPNAYGGSTCPSSGILLPPVGSSPSAAPAPSTPGKQCIPDKHGPACKSDSDCTKVPNCVRCAESGYCTEVPKRDLQNCVYDTSGNAQCKPCQDLCNTNSDCPLFGTCNNGVCQGSTCMSSSDCTASCGNKREKANKFE